jgi:hypothetical protein
LFDPAGGVEIGDVCGPVDYQWYMSGDGTGWRIFVKPNADNIAFIVKDGGGAAAGGGHIMHYTINDCDGDFYYVTPTHWTGGCEDPPGNVNYDGLWIVERMSCKDPWTTDQIDDEEVHGVASYTYPLDGYCEPIWKEINSCGPLDC